MVSTRKAFINGVYGGARGEKVVDVVINLHEILEGEEEKEREPNPCNAQSSCTEMWQGAGRRGTLSNRFVSGTPNYPKTYIP